MFAPAHHSATKYAVGPRKELAVRTIFNMLGPLTNPAHAPNLLVGVYDDSLVAPIAEVMHVLGNRHVMVVHSEDGMDEISIEAPTHVAELNDGSVKKYQITPEQFGIERGDNKDIVVNSVEESLKIMQSVLNNKKGTARDIVILNAAAAIYVAGLADSMDQGVAIADESISNGSAKKKLEALVELSNRLGETSE